MSEAADFRLTPLAFSQLEGWERDDPRPLLTAMQACRRHIEDIKPYKTGSLGVKPEELAAAFAEAPRGSDVTADQARRYFEAVFQPFQIEPMASGRGFVTAFYEPEVSVSDRADSEFRYPFYRQPDDLVEVDETHAPEGWDPGIRFGRRTAEGIELHPDRRRIDEGCLQGLGLEIAYARSKVDVFFAHVQGAARLVFPDGRQSRITYAAKSGHAFSPIGKLLIDRGEIARDEISMQAIRAWLAAHPDRVDAVLWHNRSYIFFREAAVEDRLLGPIAAAKVPLVAGRSLAVDRMIHTFGSPFFIRSDTITHMDDGAPFARLMLALDTGTAIVGPARGDIFTGSGEAAGLMAGAVRNTADFTILIPRTAAGRYGG
ncbi:murein transglycosylase A [Rhizobium halophytocola]|uniref:peptidoglycan lytic exotransglycosylase n=1 Tax=Rhizobium halophytocola TaxID=735519 RepID=A0ABS4E1M1_9HYPH|nr:murein transglycosylase A [Rhizobium halophytocola]MBP1851842.1 membrane-bound lytic murein transglycosylase A [Rhizobium halophytocola]